MRIVELDGETYFCFFDENGGFVCDKDFIMVPTGLYNRIVAIVEEQIKREKQEYLLALKESQKEANVEAKEIDNNMLSALYENGINIYLANQSLDYAIERKGEFLWSPDANVFIFMRCLKPGDIVLNYNRGRIYAVSVVEEQSVTEDFPDKEGLMTLPDVLWVKEAKAGAGLLVKLKYFNIPRPIFSFALKNDKLIKDLNTPAKGVLHPQFRYIFQLGWKDLDNFREEAKKNVINNNGLFDAIEYALKMSKKK